MKTKRLQNRNRTCSIKPQTANGHQHEQRGSSTLGSGTSCCVTIRTRLLSMPGLHPPQQKQHKRWKSSAVIFLTACNNAGVIAAASSSVNAGIFLWSSDPRRVFAR